jgi:hypothetical protein
MGSTENALEGLKQRLSAHRTRERLSWADFARRVHVAPQTLMDIIRAEPGAYRDAPSKKAAGRTETVSRIVRFVNQDADNPVNLIAVLHALGLESEGLAAAEASNKLTVTRVQEEDVLFRTHGDVVLTRIERRKLAGDPNPVKAGIDEWAPFCPPGEGMESSFAGVFMRRLLGCLNPLDWGNPELKPLGFSEASDANCVLNGKYDALFSVYDIPSRRLSGFEFIRLPGLRGALGAIAFGFDHAVTWESILDRDELSDSSLTVFVIEGEVGDFFLSGSCDYKEGQIERLGKSIKAPDIAKSLWDFIKPRLDRRGQVDPFLFCADQAITTKVELELMRIFGANLHDPRASELTGKLQRVDPQTLFSPHYPLGIAVHGRALRWIDVLRNTLQTELFMNGAALTAKHYVQMLGRHDAETLQLAELKSDLPADIADAFVGHIGHALQAFEREKGASHRRANDIRKWIGVSKTKAAKP